MIQVRQRIEVGQEMRLRNDSSGKEEVRNVLDQVKGSHAIADRAQQSIAIGREGHCAALVHHAAQIRKLEHR